MNPPSRRWPKRTNRTSPIAIRWSRNSSDKSIDARPTFAGSSSSAREAVLRRTWASGSRQKPTMFRRDGGLPCFIASDEKDLAWRAMNVAQLSYVNEQEIHRCVNRSTEFSSAPCAANTPAGPILFCKQKPRSNSNESCCQFWLCSQTRRNKCPNGVILAKVVLASFVTTTSACNSVQ